MVSHPHDLTRHIHPDRHAAGTGPLRQQRPEYVDFKPPCNHACPAGENIQAWLSLAQSGEYRAAFEKLIEENPLPAVHGRVCYHPCEDSCNRAEVDSPVSIHAVERFLGDMAIKEKWLIPPVAHRSGKRVMVVGAGPSGLSAAWHLARKGHDVQVFEAGPVAGGMMHFGIPAYRLPRDILAAEVARIQAAGVVFHMNYKIEDLAMEKAKGMFDAVFVAVGAHLSKKVQIPARDAGKILDAVSFLRESASGEPPQLGRRVAVYGGGNTAMDTARTALRMGAGEAMIIYRRDKDHMPAHEFEAEEAMAEGVKIHWLRTIKSLDTGEIMVEKMELKNGKPVPTGEYETLEADTVILALGQETDTGFLHAIPGIHFKKDGTVVVGPDMMTGESGIFAGGDMVPSERTVTVATGHGKKAARFIDGYLRNEPYIKPDSQPLVGHDQLQIWFRTFAPTQRQDHLTPQEAAGGFQEIVAGLDEKAAQYEAQRCLSCGNCFECDGCYGACPEGAIIKLGPGKRYRFDYDKCTGCGVCVEQCPCHAIDLIPEGQPII
ncbi:MAG: NAD(P)-binding protein [Saprospiraceae bacterium]|nr:NAD(P)-binding protein [Saprospiraceae bacterium]